MACTVRSAQTRPGRFDRRPNGECTGLGGPGEHASLICPHRSDVQLGKLEPSRKTLEKPLPTDCKDRTRDHKTQGFPAKFPASNSSFRNPCKLLQAALARLSVCSRPESVSPFLTGVRALLPVANPHHAPSDCARRLHARFLSVFPRSGIFAKNLYLPDRDNQEGTNDRT